MNCKKRMLSCFMVLVLILQCVSITGVKKAEASLKGNSVEEKIYYFCIEEMGMNTAAACGVLANIECESSFITSNEFQEKDGRLSYGICQWNADRRTNLEKYCNRNGYNYSSLEGQLGYLKQELLGSEKNAYSTVKNVENSANGAYQAGYNWASKFERCSSIYYEERARLARDKYWPKYGGGTPTPIHEPQGCLDIVSGGDGTVYVRGWVFDRDNLSSPVEIHVYVGSLRICHKYWRWY